MFPSDRDPGYGTSGGRRGGGNVVKNFKQSLIFHSQKECTAEAVLADTMEEEAEDMLLP